MKCICTPADIPQLGTILSIWAHPDDETYWAGGVMSEAIRRGQRVVCVTATKGEAGIQNERRWPAAQLAAIRTTEMNAALRAMGVTEHHWLGYKDGTCADIAELSAVKKLKQFIEEVQPDSILTFGPDGMTGHPDHQAVCRWVDGATTGTSIRVYHTVLKAEDFASFQDIVKKYNFFFNIQTPPLMSQADCGIAFTLTPTLLKQKRRALAAMPSQTEAILQEVAPHSLNKLLQCEYFTQAR